MVWQHLVSYNAPAGHTVCTHSKLRKTFGVKDKALILLISNFNISYDHSSHWRLVGETGLLTFKVELAFSTQSHPKYQPRSYRQSCNINQVFSGQMCFPFSPNILVPLPQQDQKGDLIQVSQTTGYSYSRTDATQPIQHLCQTRWSSNFTSLMAYESQWCKFNVVTSNKIKPFPPTLVKTHQIYKGIAHMHCGRLKGKVIIKNKKFWDHK